MCLAQWFRLLSPPPFQGGVLGNEGDTLSAMPSSFLYAFRLVLEWYVGRFHIVHPLDFPPDPHPTTPLVTL